MLFAENHVPETSPQRPRAIGNAAIASFAPDRCLECGGIALLGFTSQGVLGAGQGRLDAGTPLLDDPVGRVFPDYPRDPAHVPTFRQCFTHTSGLSGHGDWGGVRNPNFENVLLNGIDANRAGMAYEYSGNGFELVAKAMEVITGKSAPHLYQDHLFGLLGLGEVPVELASSGMRFTARELAVLAQWLANRGSYGDREFIRPATFEALLPEPLGRRCPG